MLRLHYLVAFWKYLICVYFFLILCTMISYKKIRIAGKNYIYKGRQRFFPFFFSFFYIRINLNQTRCMIRGSYVDIERVKINTRYQPFDAFARASHRCVSCIAHIQDHTKLSHVFFSSRISLILNPIDVL